MAQDRAPASESFLIACMMLTRLIMPAAVLGGAWAASCTDDDLDLCDDQEETTTTNDQETSSARRTPFSVLPFLLLASGMSGKHALMVLPFLGAPLVVEAA